jgi:hypothetical protein
MVVARPPRNTGRSYDADGREIKPMNLGNMREHGVRSVAAENFPVPDVALRGLADREDATGLAGGTVGSGVRDEIMTLAHYFRATLPSRGPQRHVQKSHDPFPVWSGGCHPSQRRS